MSRLVTILASFIAGLLVAIALLRPGTPRNDAERVAPVESAPTERDAVVVELERAIPDIGAPLPTTDSPVARKRALERAIEHLSNHPPDVEPSNTNPEDMARFADAFRAAVAEQGATP